MGLTKYNYENDIYIFGGYGAVPKQLFRKCCPFFSNNQDLPFPSMTSAPASNNTLRELAIFPSRDHPYKLHGFYLIAGMTQTTQTTSEVFHKYFSIVFVTLKQEFEFTKTSLFSHTPLSDVSKVKYTLKRYADCYDSLGAFEKRRNGSGY